MCGRYVMARAAADLVAEAEAEADANLELRASWNVAPTSDVPVVLERLVDGRRARQVHVARWGLVPGWAKDASVGVRAFNARSETVLEKPTFRDAVAARRCAVPVDGYYEWMAGPGKVRQPFYVSRTDGRPIYFAGLYEWWRDPAKDPGDPDRWLLSTSILTVASPPADSAEPVLRELAGLHDRLPLPLSPEAMTAWLDSAALAGTDTAALLAAATGQAYAAASDWHLRKAHHGVGNVRNDGAYLLQPDPAAAREDVLF
ncbi:MULTISPECIES: SOS response-associated peptidase [unclassified Arthrobacter]|uniref:SOS response-associated peptidase n=1 Tax=unclassified Arthrobacter TaxID=235627 RepID=UPI001D15933D|nr:MULTISPECIES: SOS response-associated peptidase [unclassified Arthrobacter]MCC3274925.1 SOS response-associated peptidase [Arthrobacter sp. zg-Y20]MCC9177481.1 SOS response-associated peptidase [Arthrobacter sp. zg-Y750]MDK1315081.1 SOS response-associated peptidase [Arthrobacter sp. zg.Y20]WIB04928.1 SOS response-associated peptidase [Arthrobacter sp. zg-Y20]